MTTSSASPLTPQTNHYHLPELNNKLKHNDANFLEQHSYGCIIDAGSSGSRIYIYRWPKRRLSISSDRRRVVLPPPITQVEREALLSRVGTPGISGGEEGIDRLVELIDLAKGALVDIFLAGKAGEGTDDNNYYHRYDNDSDDLMIGGGGVGSGDGYVSNKNLRNKNRYDNNYNMNDNDAVSNLQQNMQEFLQSIPIYLGATAGMRILPLDKELSIIQSVRGILRNSGFLFRDSWARTISGEEEGAYGWLVVNYLKNGGNLVSFPEEEERKFAEIQSSSGTADKTAEVATKDTFGALDLGGASTQITFQSSGSILSNQYPLRIGHVEYSLYTHSYLYYGVDQARFQYDTKIATREVMDTTIVNEVSKSNSIINSNDSNTKSTTININNNNSYNATTKLINPCYPTGYTNPTTQVTGSSQWEQCLQTVRFLFDKSHPCYHGDGASDRCSFNGVYQPPHHASKKFVAMSSFIYTWSYLGLSTGKHTSDLFDLKRRASHFCNLSYEEQKMHYDQRRKEDPNGIWVRLDKQGNQCFNAAYSYHLLSTGYGLPVKGTPVEVRDVIWGTTVQWALGMMMVEANKLGWDYDDEDDGYFYYFGGHHGEKDVFKYLFVSLTPMFAMLSITLMYLLYMARSSMRGPSVGWSINCCSYCWWGKKRKKQQQQQYSYTVLEGKGSPPPGGKSGLGMDLAELPRRQIHVLPM